LFTQARLYFQQRSCENFGFGREALLWT
jgi:hypothetical protein